jgi:surface polysaccharide O-acyltransferase-like enzyme
MVPRFLTILTGRNLPKIWQPREPEQRKRESGIDAVRFLAFPAVVLIHLPSHDVPYSFAISWSGVVDHLCRFAVPYYFVATGYFLAHDRLGVPKAIARFIARLLPVFVFWEAIYLLVVHTQLRDLKELSFWRSVLFHGGPAFHLWFLSSLGVCVTAAILLKRFTTSPVYLSIGALCFLVGLSFGPYRAALHLPNIGSTRTGPWFGLIFVLSGVWIGTKNVNTSLQLGSIFAAAGLSCQIAEAALLTMSEGYFAPNDFFFGTLLYGIGMFMIARSLADGKLVNTAASLGRLSLGMYCAHLLFIWMLVGRAQVQFGYAQQILAMAAVVFFSTTTAFVLSRIPLLERVVR